jgi:hypothetical protein
MRATDLAVGRLVAFGALHGTRDDRRHQLGDPPHDVGVLGLRRPNARTIAAVTSGYRRRERFDRRSTDITRSAAVASASGWSRCRPGGPLAARHRFEEQPLLRREVAVHGAERDVGRGGTSRICTASNPPPARARTSRRAPGAGARAWLRARVLSGSAAGRHRN